MTEGFQADRTTYGDELCGAAELLSDQIAVCRDVLRHHFPGTEENPAVVLDAQRCLSDILNSPSFVEAIPDGDEEVGEVPSRPAGWRHDRCPHHFMQGFCCWCGKPEGDPTVIDG